MMLDNVKVTGPARTSLTVASSPGTGVSVGVSPQDVNGSSTGTTSFSRSYYEVPS